MNYNTPPPPPPPPRIPWNQTHCCNCGLCATSTKNMTKNYTQCFSCLSIFCNSCMISGNGYHEATEAFRSTKICPECAKSNLLESHIILQSRNFAFRKAFITHHLETKIDFIIARYIKLFL